MTNTGPNASLLQGSKYATHATRSREMTATGMRKSGPINTTAISLTILPELDPGVIALGHDVGQAVSSRIRESQSVSHWLSRPSKAGSTELQPRQPSPAAMCA